MLVELVKDQTETERQKNTENPKTEKESEKGKTRDDFPFRGRVCEGRDAHETAALRREIEAYFWTRTQLTNDTLTRSYNVDTQSQKGWT